MGGFGSGSHNWRWSKKTVVEKCLQLSTTLLRREGVFNIGDVAMGTWRWTYHSGGSFVVNYEVNTLDEFDPSLRLWFTWIWTSTQQRESADYRVRLVTTCPQFGGLRWWFICPLTVNGRSCGRRVAKLYLPPRSRYFGCRHCHELTYTSAQEHDKRVDRLRRNPAALLPLMDNLETLSTSQMLLALKASRLADRRT